MSCPSKTYPNIAPDLFAGLVEMAAQQGLVLEGTSGTAEMHGCKFTWGYDEQAGELTIECFSKPIWIGCGTINDKLDGLLKL